MTGKTKVAIIGSGNIGTDLMIKIMRRSQTLELAALVGIDPASQGLEMARRHGIGTTHEGIEGLRRMPVYPEIALVFDATSAAAHAHHSAALLADGKRVLDLTPAALGPYVVPVVNLDSHADAPNLNMVTCGGQATIPIVAAISAVTSVRYAEIVASIASRSAGPGTRANIDEFTETTSRALEAVGGADRGKAIIILNPAEPPLMMRDTVLCLADAVEPASIVAAVEHMVAQVATYVPGYRLKQPVQVEPMTDRPGQLKVTVMLEIEGAGHYLPSYAGNLDIMTSAALATAERLAAASAGA
ncbi:MAG TPA: acetaldehyde dehydrogenase (acetylating) [Devosia sp.]|nr:acetaldehyde dehydrogenase (acetylating) [Devosia sp.]